MGVVNITKSVKDRVKYILSHLPKNRDDDHLLLANIWLQELKSQGLPPEEAKKFCSYIAENKLTHPESIRRIRAKLQNDYPELRGSKYSLRRSRESKVRKDLGYQG